MTGDGQQCWRSCRPRLAFGNWQLAFGIWLWDAARHRPAESAELDDGARAWQSSLLCRCRTRGLFVAFTGPRRAGSLTIEGCIFQMHPCITHVISSCRRAWRCAGRRIRTQPVPSCRAQDRKMHADVCIALPNGPRGYITPTRLATRSIPQTPDSHGRRNVLVEAGELDPENFKGYLCRRQP